MTAQIDDCLIWKGTKYKIVSLDVDSAMGLFENQLFHPAEQGIIFPEMISTACYRGFYCLYELVEDSLYLSKLTVQSRGGNYPAINGALPGKDRQDGCAEYTSLRLPIESTGHVRVGHGFIKSKFVYMGFQEATAYEVIKDLHFKAGKLVKCIDLSEDIKRLRAVQEEVEAFLKVNWVTREWKRKLRERYAYVDHDDIERTFERRPESLDTDRIQGILEDIKRERKTPRGFFLNFKEFYAENCQYGLTFFFFGNLGCPQPIVDFLSSLVSPEQTEAKVGAAFIETLKSTILGALWGDTLNFITGNQFVEAHVDPEIKKRIEEQLSGVTLDSWT